MTHYRVKSLTIEAMQWTGKNRVEIARFIRGNKLTGEDDLLLPGDTIIYKNGTIHKFAKINDWVLKDINGTIKFCDPAYFVSTFEAVD